ncbi:hypothetical protein T10_4856 [Trichinella papuae]|uniref:Uncharacterized protein n=2 Tax=Trichinella papuae TaxID=268474 RepID=A0A0V1M167_9BILA|nr:hypothetical protein T10_8463 [Trichinella papuae]KRZ66946.1 hypothetical protein T10_4856 [Trichinella papuae]
MRQDLRLTAVRTRIKSGCCEAAGTVDEHTAYKMEKRAMMNKRSAEESKTFPQSYEEEAAAASTEPSTCGQFLLFKEVRSVMYKQRVKRFPRLPRDR